jgi:hypothetical protein
MCAMKNKTYRSPVLVYNESRDTFVIARNGLNFCCADLFGGRDKHKLSEKRRYRLVATTVRQNDEQLYVRFRKKPGCWLRAHVLPDWRDWRFTHVALDAAAVRRGIENSILFVSLQPVTD